MKEEALKLADELNQIDEVAYSDLMVIEKGIAMIRRLVEELDKQTKPLSDEEIINVAKETDWFLQHNPDWSREIINFARAIEKRHKIK